jgi:hypothetical protein
MFFKQYISLLFICLSSFFYTQEEFEKANSYFGIQLKPLIPNNFISQTEYLLNDGPLTTKFTQNTGYSFGAITRIGLTKLLSIETGINQVKRNYSIYFEQTDSLVNTDTKMSMISYDIPLNIMVYVQLSKLFYMNTSLGSSLIYFPSNIGVVSVVDKQVFVAEGRRIRHFGATINANFGFEMRTTKSGYFYIGASGVIPLKPIYYFAGSYEYNNSVRNSSFTPINGAYLTIDFRYFFPNIPKKGIQMNQGPITQ